MFKIIKFYIYSFCLFTSFKTFSASKDKAGMPQLDVSTYPSLIFWLIVTFGFTFLVLKFFITPKLSEILNQRKERISADLFAAKSSREEAENSKTNQERSISDAKNKANKIVKDAIEKTKNTLQETEKKAKERLTKTLLDAEKNISDTKNKSLKNITLITTEIAVAISKKVSGINIKESIISKNIKDQISKSDDFKNLEAGN